LTTCEPCRNSFICLPKEETRAQSFLPVRWSRGGPPKGAQGGSARTTRAHRHVEFVGRRAWTGRPVLYARSRSLRDAPVGGDGAPGCARVARHGAPPPVTGPRRASTPIAGLFVVLLHLPVREASCVAVETRRCGTTVVATTTATATANAAITAPTRVATTTPTATTTPSRPPAAVPLLRRRRVARFPLSCARLVSLQSTLGALHLAHFPHFFRTPLRSSCGNVVGLSFVWAGFRAVAPRFVGSACAARGGLRGPLLRLVLSLPVRKWGPLVGRVAAAWCNGHSRSLPRRPLLWTQHFFVWGPVDGRS